MLPIANLGDRFFGSDFERVVGPRVDDVNSVLSVLVIQVPATMFVSFIHLRNNGCSAKFFGRFRPNPKAERIGKRKIPERPKVNRVSIFQNDRWTKLAVGFPFHIFLNRHRNLKANRAGDLISTSLVKGHL